MRDAAREFVERPVADIDDQSRILGTRKEARRQAQAVDRMMPPQQGFGERDLATAQRNLRLVEIGELAADDRVAQLGFQA